MTQQSRNRLVLVLIAALFFIPVLAAVLLQPGWFGQDPERTVNRGELVQPPVPLLLNNVELVDGASALDQTRGHWTLLHVIGDAPCDERCTSTVTDLRQIHTATGRRQEQVRVLIFGSPLDRPRLRSIDDRFLLTESSDVGLAMSIVAATGQSGGIGPNTDAGEALTGATFIVDPEGNLMLRYAPGYAREDLNKDLEKLLKWSGR